MNFDLFLILSMTFTISMQMDPLKTNPLSKSKQTRKGFHHNEQSSAFKKYQVKKGTESEKTNFQNEVEEADPIINQKNQRKENNLTIQSYTNKIVTMEEASSNGATLANDGGKASSSGAATTMTAGDEALSQCEKIISISEEETEVAGHREAIENGNPLTHEEMSTLKEAWSNVGQAWTTENKYQKEIEVVGDREALSVANENSLLQEEMSTMKETTWSTGETTLEYKQHTTILTTGNEEALSRDEQEETGQPIKVRRISAAEKALVSNGNSSPQGQKSKALSEKCRHRDSSSEKSLYRESSSEMHPHSSTHLQCLVLSLTSERDQQDSVLEHQQQNVSPEIAVMRREHNKQSPSKKKSQPNSTSQSQQTIEDSLTPTAITIQEAQLALLSQIQGTLEQILKCVQSNKQTGSSSSPHKLKHNETNVSRSEDCRQLEKFIRKTNRQMQKAEIDIPPVPIRSSPVVDGVQEQLNEFKLNEKVMLLDDLELLIFITLKSIRHPINVQELPMMWQQNKNQSAVEILTKIDQLESDPNLTAEAIIEALKAALCIINKDAAILSEIEIEVAEFEKNFEQNLQKWANLISKKLKILFVFLRLFKKLLNAFSERDDCVEDKNKETFADWLSINYANIGNKLNELARTGADVFTKATNWIFSVDSLEKTLALADVAILLTLPNSMQTKFKLYKRAEEESLLFNTINEKKEFLAQFNSIWFNPWKEKNCHYQIRKKLVKNFTAPTLITKLRIIFNLHIAKIEGSNVGEIWHSPNQLNPKFNRMLHRNVFFHLYKLLNAQEIETITVPKLVEARNNVINSLVECIQLIENVQTT